MTKSNLNLCLFLSLYNKTTFVIKFTKHIYIVFECIATTTIYFISSARLPFRSTIYFICTSTNNLFRQLAQIKLALNSFLPKVVEILCSPLLRKKQVRSGRHSQPALTIPSNNCKILTFLNSYIVSVQIDGNKSTLSIYFWVQGILNTQI